MVVANQLADCSRQSDLQLQTLCLRTRFEIVEWCTCGCRQSQSDERWRRVDNRQSGTPHQNRTTDGRGWRLRLYWVYSLADKVFQILKYGRNLYAGKFLQRRYQANTIGSALVSCVFVRHEVRNASKLGAVDVNFKRVKVTQESCPTILPSRMSLRRFWALIQHFLLLCVCDCFCNEISLRVAVPPSPHLLQEISQKTSMWYDA